MMTFKKKANGKPHNNFVYKIISQIYNCIAEGLVTVTV